MADGLIRISENHLKNALKEINNDQSTHVSYIEFINYFSSNHKISTNEYVIGTHFTYGWMPTILTLKIKNIKECVDIVNLARHTKRIEEYQFEILCQSINNSLVGTSKLLHFINPELYPIWDSRVCRFLDYPQSKIRNILTYIDYQNRCLERIKHRDYENIHNQIARALGYAVSKLRSIELIMFYNGAKKDVGS